jgi:hypothetical protein
LVSRGGAAPKNNTPVIEDDEFERAEKAIFDAVGRVEHKLEKAIEQEVDVLFHDVEHNKKEQVKAKAKKIVETGAKKVKASVDKDAGTLPFTDSHFPYEWPEEGDPHRDHRVLHAVESAEKAFLHAVENEVATLFRDLSEEHRNEPKIAKNAETGIKSGVEKAKKAVDEAHKNRRDWLSVELGAAFEDYVESSIE